MSFLASQRFELLELLGTGAFGTVHRALDRETNRYVAVKLLREMSADALARFKSEFRALQDIQNRYIVHFSELFEDEGTWFFSMELVEGPELGEWVRPEGRLDEGRLRHAFAELAEGLAALHQIGLVHRDLKPANVRVRPDGSVVLLDFGLVTDRTSRTREIVGTPAYMAPEQARGSEVGSAADMYSLGIMLYECLTGKLPPYASFGAPVFDPLPSSRSSEVSADLNELCAALLEGEARRRPIAAEVRRALREEGATDYDYTSRPSDSPFVGRSHELGVLQQAQRLSLEHCHSVAVVGESGVGKTALVEAFLVGKAKSALILRGRCFEQESVPFKAIDGMIDALALALREYKDLVAGLDAISAGCLRVIFPVLGRVLADVPRDQLPSDPLKMRERAFDALAELLTSLSHSENLVLVIDDVQWGDAESLTFLRLWTRSESARGLLLFTSRPLATECPAEIAKALKAILGSQGRVLELSGLSGGDTRELARTLLQAGYEDEILTSVEVQSSGHPLFVAELVREFHRSALQGRRAQTDLDAVLERRVRETPQEPRAMLELLALAPHPVSREFLFAAHGQEDGEQHLKFLRVSKLIRTTPRDGTVLCEPFHDRLRKAARTAIDAAVEGACHERLVSALEATDSDDFDMFYTHCVGAKFWERARSYAIAAAEVASKSLAFAQAALRYRSALDLPLELSTSERTSLELRLAESLRLAGHGSEAAQIFERCARQLGSEDARKHLITATQQYLQSGLISDGLRVAREVLEPTGERIPETPKGSLVSLLYNRARIRFARFDFSDFACSADGLRDVDTLLAVGTAMTMVDFIRGADFQARALRRALKSGDPCRRVHALATEGATAGCTDEPPMRRGATLLSRAEAEGDRLGDPFTSAHVNLCWAAAELAQFRFPEAHGHAEKASAVFSSQCSGVGWELSTCHHVMSMSYWNFGRYRDLSRKTPRWIQEAEDRSDIYGVTTMTVGSGFGISIAADRPVEGVETVLAAMARWNQPTFQIQHYMRLQALSELWIYAGKPENALDHLASVWREFNASLLPTIPVMKWVGFAERAKAHLASVRSASKDLRARHIKAARADIRSCRKHMRQPVNDALCDQLELELDLAERSATPSDIDKLHSVEERLQSASMAAIALSARLRRGLLIGGDDGAALVNEAELGLASCGIKRPRQYAWFRAPGVWE